MLPDVRTIWRWHFYAGLFCVPFVLWLSLTGIIYLFKPQIEGWMDRPYEGLLAPGESALRPGELVTAALASAPGSSLSYYQLPRNAGGAPQIVVNRDLEEQRIYIHPGTAEVLHRIGEQDRPLSKVFLLHGELMAGDKGSMLIELAGCWTIVLILTGLALWWPRTEFQAAGFLYPRLQLTGRLWWKDLHSVTGLWASIFVLGLLLTGLPWAKSWGGYFRMVRTSFAGITTAPDWPAGGSSENAGAANSRSGHGLHSPPKEAEKAPARFGKRAMQPPPVPDAYAAIDRLLPAVERLPLAYPVQILPPVRKGGSWFARSNSQNRMRQDSFTLDPANGAILRHEKFSDKPAMDRVVSMGISYHEGQLFGILNQMVGLLTALGAATLSLSSVVMWWRRRPAGTLGAPVAAQWPAVGLLAIASILVLAVVFPMLGVSIIALALLERVVLRRSPGISRWLGMAQA